MSEVEHSHHWEWHQITKDPEYGTLGYREHIYVMCQCGEARKYPITYSTPKREFKVTIGAKTDTKTWQGLAEAFDLVLDKQSANRIDAMVDDIMREDEIGVTG